mmetsp:Transcript_10948/g.22412  ORF Transcript_10948/g.22412 Transcript_10948/m.22412 type:complete len:549 (-) Transcript_10948:98-1744(-)
MEAPSIRKPAHAVGQLPASGGMKSDDIHLKAQEEVVRGFAAALGKPKEGSLPKEMMIPLLADSLTNHDVVLIVPSFDMQVSEDKAGNPLPGVGETSKQPAAPSPEQSEEPPPASPLTPGNKPQMSASVLTTATNEAADLEQKAAQSIGSETSWTKSTLLYARDAIVTNISDSFNRFTDSRLRAWTLLLLRHSLSTGDSSSRSRLLGILQASLKVSATFTKFKVLPMPSTASSRTAPDMVILPLLFEVSMQISLKDKMEIVTLRSPGTVAATFAMGDKPTSLKSVMINLDSAKFLSAMVEQVRILVLKAVATATKTAVPIPSDDKSSNGQPQQEQSNVQSQGDTAQRGLSTFRSMLNLNPSTAAAEKNPSFLKARNSALRLNGVLHGDKTKEPAPNPLGLRKNRSVHWNSPAQLPSLQPGNALAPQPKKSRRAQTAAKLKSFKSFGRPHAGDFGSGPRNATFGEFSRAQMWGRDGRMAHHPVPMQKASMSLMAEDPQPKGNAKFQVPSSVRLQTSFQSTTAPTAGVSSSLPRSATVLENILLKKASGKM